MSFLNWVLKMEQEFTRQPGTLEGSGRAFWAKDRAVCLTSWLAQKTPPGVHLRNWGERPGGMQVIQQQRWARSWEPCSGARPFPIHGEPYSLSRINKFIDLGLKKLTIVATIQEQIWVGGEVRWQQWVGGSVSGVEFTTALSTATKMKDVIVIYTFSEVLLNQNDSSEGINQH